jgi:hypothetical protein
MQAPTQLPIIHRTSINASSCRCQTARWTTQAPYRSLLLFPRRPRMIMELMENTTRCFAVRMRSQSISLLASLKLSDSRNEKKSINEILFSLANYYSSQQRTTLSALLCSIWIWQLPLSARSLCAISSTKSVHRSPNAMHIYRGAKGQLRQRWRWRCCCFCSVAPITHRDRDRFGLVTSLSLSLA